MGESLADSLRSRPGRALVGTMAVLLVCDITGGAIAWSDGARTWSESWGFDAKTTVPLPMAAAQLALAWLAARDMRRARAAALLLAGICVMSLIFGALDGDLIGNVRAEGVGSLKVVWAVVLLLGTAVVGSLAWTRAQQLSRG